MKFKDRTGREITKTEWQELLADDTYRRIARTEFPDGKIVSTVWLGFDHGWGACALYFETMVFASESDMREIDLLRYETEAEAVAGHEALVRKWAARVHRPRWTN